jgi:hypothetical protein
MKKNHNDPFQIIPIPEADYLYIQTSQIPGAGQGLFTAIDIYKDEIISYFLGEILTAREARLRASKQMDQYFIGLLNGTIMDSAGVHCFAKYANDSSGSNPSGFRHNARIALDDNGSVCLIATKKIQTGEEIFCSYGKKYWKKHGELV